MKNHLKEKAWTKLEALTQQKSFESQHFICQTDGLQLDFSQQWLPAKALDLLIELAEHSQLKERIGDLVSGQKINISEQRPALHTALRANGNVPVIVDQMDVMPDILKTKEAIQNISDLVRNQLWFGRTGKPITDVVNIGIGGSDLGPRFCIQALQEYHSEHLKCHFVSDVSPNAFEIVTKHLNPESTLFIISSKSFTTPETLYNAKKAFQWIGNQVNWQQHFIAVTANLSQARAQGYSHILPIWDWVGGRFSFCSAINLITAIAIGYEQFDRLLTGANHMDTHFLNQDFYNNMPVLAGLIGIWNINFKHIHNHLILTYAHELEKFVPYIQQVDMESNGKSLTTKGERVQHATGPIVWGGPGNQAQHSYYQSLCQGTHQFTADFITLKAFENDMINQMANNKMNTLYHGIGTDQLQNDFVKGQMSLNHIQIDSISPYNIGQLVAMYEHKIFVQSQIWDINPFDQPGVESAKKHAGKQNQKQLQPS